MNATNSLISTSVLYTIWERERKTFSDVLSQFVLFCLSHTKPEEVNVEDLCTALSVEFGLDLPCPVCEKILKRISKKQPTILKKNNKRFILLTSNIDTSEFVNERRRTKENLEQVITSLTCYLESNSAHYKKDMNVEDVWSSFLEKYGYYYFKDTSTALAYTRRYDSIYYALGSFILQAYDEDGVLWESILHLLNGLMIAKVLVYESDNDDIQTKRFSNVTFYLDTPILLNVLGYLSPYEQKSSMQMIELLQKMGASFACFDEHFHEVRDILTAYILGRSNPRRNWRTLAGLDSKRLNRQQLLVQKDTIEKKLLNRGISIVQRPQYNFDGKIQPNSRKYIDEAALCKKLAETIHGYDLKDLALKNDVSAIAAIGILRDGRAMYSLERCCAVFITSNTRLVRCATEVLHNNPFRDDEIPLILDDVYLTTHAWLKSAKKKSDQTLLKIIANANAAIRPSEGFRAATISRIDSMKEHGDFTSDEAIIAQTDWMLIDAYTKAAEGDPEQLNDAVIKNAFEKFKTSVIESEVKRFQQEKINAEAERVRDEEKHKDVSKILSDIRIYSQKAGNLVCKVLMALSGIIGAGVFITIGVCIGFQVASVNFASIVLLLFSVWEMADFFLSKRSSIRKGIKKLGYSVEQFAYNRRLIVASKYNPSISDILNEVSKNS